ncbi:hypothetical protein T459_03024 [Capsicum annuum]|uniref:Uncharacterized protein n=1 Tax=Capsicum annuum TaxID=4072 RepID=A0A2G3ALP5_CAPAN|nr:hypothetical protein T459_03024 [Capsicum annuum]
MNAASTGEAAKLRAILIKDVGMMKKDRFSWIYTKDSIHIFQAKDTTHERYPEIQAMLAKLKRDVKAADMTKILELEPLHDQARRSVTRLKPLADENQKEEHIVHVTHMVVDDYLFVLRDSVLLLRLVA